MKKRGMCSPDLAEARAVVLTSVEEKTFSKLLSGL
jgi:hypothetical protein